MRLFLPYIYFYIYIYIYIFFSTNWLPQILYETTPRIPKKPKQKFDLIWKFYFMQYLQVSYKSYISFKAAAWRCSLENMCAGVSFFMLCAVVSVPCQEHVKDKILTHFPTFLSSNSLLFCFLLQRFDLPFENFILYVYCRVDIKSVFRILPNIEDRVFCKNN